MERLVIYFLFFISGTAALIYEVLWVRILGLSLGVTVYATALVLMAYMAGLALGSAVWGRYIDTKKNEFLKKYAWLELAIGLSALAVSIFFIQISNVQFLSLPYAVLYPTVFCLLVLPTFFMGGTLPIMSKYLIQSTGNLGKEAGALYALNTLGGVAGCFGTGFFLIRILGVHQSIYVSVALNVLVAVIALVLNWKTKKTGNKHLEPQEQIPVRPIPDFASGLSTNHVLAILALYGISGFCSLGYEVLWTRALMFKIGNDTYAFSLMLGTFLLGLALGSFIFARISCSVKKAFLILGTLQLFIALTIALGIGLLFRMDAVIDTLWLHTGKTWLSAISARFIAAFLLMGIPTLCMGGIFPLVARLCSQSVQTAGKSIGSLYSANTIGTILGTGLVGFIGLPLLGITNSILVLTVLNVIVGIVFLFILPMKKVRWFGIMVAVGIIVVCIMETRPEPLPLTAAHLARTQEKYDLLYYREGVSATVTVVKAANDMKMLNVNGVYTAFTSIGDLQVHYMLGYLPYLFANNPRSALVIGLGLGVTSSSLTAARMHVDCVELAREEIGSTPFFAEYNDTILSQPGFRLIIDDGRHYLLRTTAKYDVITSNAVHVRTSPYLYTKEFYGLCRDRLAPGGAVCQWLPTNNIPEKEFKQLVSAFLSVFQHTTVWYINPGHFLLLGTLDRLTIDCMRLQTRLQQENIRTMLHKVNLDNPAVFMSLLLMDEDDVARFAALVAPHTDDHPAAEFVRVLESRAHDCYSIPSTYCASKLPLSSETCGTDSAEMDKAFAATLVSRHAETTQWSGNLSEALEEYSRALSLNYADSRTSYLRKLVLNQAMGVLMQKAGEYVERNDFHNAINKYSHAMQLDTNLADPYFGLGFCYYQLGDTGKAKPAFRQAVRKGIGKKYVEIINHLIWQ
jgi:spermidine synthase